MIRNLKVLGLALVAVLAMSAMAASAASAQQGKLTSATGVDVTLTGNDTGVAQNRLTVGTDFVECPNSTYTGHNSSKGFLANGATEVTVTPHYLQNQPGGTPNCDATGGLSATVAMNGCDYRFYDFTTSPAGNKVGTYSFLADLICPVGKNVEVRIYSGHGHAFEVCKDVVTPGTGFTGGHATNGAGGHINLTGTVKGFKVHKSGLCGSGEFNGEYDVDVTVKAHTTAGLPVGVSLSD